MQARHDLRKFITELSVAQRGAVLSSGRELPVPGRLVREVAQGGEMTVVRAGAGRGETDRRPVKDRGIDNVGRLTPGAGSETSTRKSSDQTAAEALQEAETEVGTTVSVRSGARVAGQSRPADPVIDVGLTA
ncbi:hypothetical protein KOI35_41850 [Actinoplanes bogorensis]|uniref:Uncharacterized protein n=1 Tax=Paractinoplanes bogorensis TaxID=1610840 RepID=A0ABS5Z2Z3_9ACTN|nr:hypothetical protein [Actinoplanes bogorensis]MBU2670070.1 hypothetical protein [Actinoplanes bogorensis]